MATSSGTTTGTFAAGETASGVAAAHGLTPEQFLSYNPDLAAKGHPNDYKGLTGDVNVGQTYNLGPTSKPSSLIVTAGPTQSAFSQHSSSLDMALKQLGVNNTPSPATTTTSTDTTTASDPIISGLNTLKTQNDAATNSLVASTQAAYQNKINAAQKEGDNYKAGLQLLGIQHNEATFSPDLLSSHITKAANDTLDKINGLKAEEAKVLMDAQTAKAKNDFQTLSDSMARYKEIQTEKNQAVKDMHSSLASANREVTFDSPALYEAYNTLDDADKEAFIQAVADKYGASVMSVMSALTTEKQKETKADLATQNARATLAKKRSGGSTGGMSKAQIQLGEDKLNATRGDDGYVDPFVYAQAFKEWKGTTKQFLTAYPPADYVNPAATNLPKYLMPKSKASSSQTA